MTENTDTRLRELRDRTERAQSRYEEQERALYRGDGEPIYGAPEMEERLRDLRSERSSELREVEQGAREVAEASRARAEDAENADPLAVLTAAELDRANARRAFAMDAAESLDADALLGRLRSVLRSGDRAEIAAYLMAGQRQRTRILERRNDEAARSGGAPVAVTPIDEALGGLRAALVGDGSAEAEAAKRREREAVAVEMLASTLSVGERSAAGAWVRRNARPA